MPEQEWSARISKVKNGFIVKTPEGNLVFEDSEGDEDSLYSLLKAFHSLQEYFGIYNSKHNKRNIVMTVVDNEQVE